MINTIRRWLRVHVAKCATTIWWLHNAETIVTFLKLLNLTYLVWLPHPSSLVARLPVDEPALASIMTQDHAKGLCASELDPLRI